MILKIFVRFIYLLQVLRIDILNQYQRLSPDPLYSSYGEMSPTVFQHEMK